MGFGRSLAVLAGEKGPYCLPYDHAPGGLCIVAHPTEMETRPETRMPIRVRSPTSTRKRYPSSSDECLRGSVSPGNSDLAPGLPSIRLLKYLRVG
jgi:hypothetical protein